MKPKHYEKWGNRGSFAWSRLRPDEPLQTRNDWPDVVKFQRLVRVVLFLLGCSLLIALGWFMGVEAGR